MGLGGAAVAESDPGLSILLGAALGAGAGLLAGIVTPRHALGGLTARRNTAYWRYYRPFLVVLYLVVAVGNMQVGRWILGVFMVAVALTFHLLPRPSRDGDAA
ncbi:hypothetical protein [Streptomyces sp. NPDC048172]|uniref:hypothetical protein n=1 Tax=Streptomyces sp. NPDC048172 TaxID=3365505 RepID=UPI0037169B7E